MPVGELEVPARRIGINVDHARHVTHRYSHIVCDLDEGHDLKQIQMKRVVSTMC